MFVYCGLLQAWLRVFQMPTVHSVQSPQLPPSRACHIFSFVCSTHWGGCQLAAAALVSPGAPCAQVPGSLAAPGAGEWPASFLPLLFLCPLCVSTTCWAQRRGWGQATWVCSHASPWSTTHKHGGCGQCVRSWWAWPTVESFWSSWPCGCGFSHVAITAQCSAHQVHSSLIHPAGLWSRAPRWVLVRRDGNLQPLCPGTLVSWGPGWEPSKDGVQRAQDEQPLLPPWEWGGDLPPAAAFSLVLRQTWPIRVEMDRPVDLHPAPNLVLFMGDSSICPRQTGNCKQGKAGLLVTSGCVPPGTYWGPSR